MALARQLKGEVSEQQTNRRKELGTQKQIPGNRKPHKTKQEASDEMGEYKCYKRKRAMIIHSSDHVNVKNLVMEGPSDHVNVKNLVMEGAKEIQANLPAEFPSFVKSMLPSHVTGGFWLGLPKRFCVLHLPRVDTIIVLEDENGKEYNTKYLAEKAGLSGGWRGFSIAHKLIEGDVLVFHLVNPSKFKVYIVRSNCLDEVDGVLGLQNLEACSRKLELGKKCLEPLTMDICGENSQKSIQVVVDTKNEHIEDQFENDSEVLGSEVFEGIRFSETVVDFKEVNTIENFTVVVNGLIIDTELSKHVRTKYYELCCSQKSFLHEHLLEGINCKLAAGIISETTNIADAIRSSTATTTFKGDLVIWDKTLKAFEELGMDVSFLRARLEPLVCKDSKVYADEEKRSLQEKLLEMRETAKRLDAEVQALKGSCERIAEVQLMFQEVTNAPW